VGSRVARGAAAVVTILGLTLGVATVRAGIERVSVADGRLTLEADDAPVMDVLRRLAEAKIVTVIGEPTVERRVSLTLSDVPLAEALKRILGDLRYIASYDEGAGARAAVEIRFLGPGSGPRDVAAAPPAPPTPEWVTRAAANPERSARMRAIQALARQRTAEATTTLVGMMRDDADATVRERAAAALVEIGGRDLGSAFLAALSDAAPFVRVQAIRGLARVQPDAAVPPLTRAAESDTDAAVRRAATEALARLPGGMSKR
jgi:HEAT repeat protein